MFQKKILTLVYVLSESDQYILLGLKKRGFGQGKWNGFGGKLHAGETIAQAAVREVEEECGLLVFTHDLDYVGLIDFEFIGDPVHLEVHVFLARKFSGVVTESEEMSPKWFSINNMPYDKMWADDEHWHPIVFGGKKFSAYFLFEGLDKIVEQKIDIKDQLSLEDQNIV